MTMRSRKETVTFQHPFRIEGIDRLLPAGGVDAVAFDCSPGGATTRDLTVLVKLFHY